MSIEPLEARIAPAGLKSVNWLDWDGDTVTLTWTGANTPTVNTGINNAVNSIVLPNANDAIGITVQQGPHGDGRVDLGYINATGLPLKSFTAPKASVLEFDCGNGTSAIGTLTLGSYGTVEPSAFTAPGGNHTGTLLGSVGAVKIVGDFDYGVLKVGNSGVVTKIGSITIGGSLHGDVSAAIPGLGSGSLFIESPCGPVKIGRNIVGGADDDGGSITILNSVSSLKIGGSVIGGPGAVTGAVDGDAGSLVIGGSIIGGGKFGSGVVSGHFQTVTVGGSIIGGSSYATGNLRVSPIGVAQITVKGSVIGGHVTGFSSAPDRFNVTGTVEVTGSANLHLGGDLIAGTASGGALNFNGAIVATGALTLAIGGGIEGSNLQRACIVAGAPVPPVKEVNYNGIASLTVGGSVDFAVIASGQDYSTATATANLGNAEVPDAGIGRVTIGGDFQHSSLMAGTNDSDKIGVGRVSNGNSYDTQSGGDPLRMAVLGPVTIKGAILDDAGAEGDSGFEAQQITKITAGGLTVFKHGDPLHFFDFSQFVFAAEI